MFALCLIYETTVRIYEHVYSLPSSSPPVAVPPLLSRSLLLYYYYYFFVMQVECWKSLPRQHVNFSVLVSPLLVLSLCVS